MAASRFTGSVIASGTGAAPVMGAACSGLVPQVMVGGTSAASILMT
jgi:hypothetical protein